jgi:hypothetical protein
MRRSIKSAVGAVMALALFWMASPAQAIGYIYYSHTVASGSSSGWLYDDSVNFKVAADVRDARSGDDCTYVKVTVVVRRPFGTTSAFEIARWRKCGGLRGVFTITDSWDYVNEVWIETCQDYTIGSDPCVRKTIISPY